MPHGPRKPYEPRHGEPVTDKQKTGRVAALHYGSQPDVVDVRWSDGTTQARVPSSTLSHDCTSGEN